MLRSRKLSSACIALGAASLMVTTSVPVAYGHGYTNAPTSRAKFCQQGTVSNCGPIQWEPQSVEGPKGFPGAGPADGKLCSAGLSQFAQLDDPRNGAWPTTSVRSGQSYTFRWQLTAAHRTTNFKYYITKQGWNSNTRLTRSALDLTPFLTVNLNGAQPPSSSSHPGTMPSRSGRHLILAVWTIHDTANAFYQCSDVNFG